MGRRLAKGPWLQVALDMINLQNALELAEALPTENLILEVGTPLLKSHGIEAIRAVKAKSQGRTVIVDTKTLDAAAIEVELVHIGGGDGATVSAMAHWKTLDSFLRRCNELSLISVVDLMGYRRDPIELESIKESADVFLIHYGIDQGTDRALMLNQIKVLKEKFKDVALAVAGGISPDISHDLLLAGADIIVVGRYITTSPNPAKAAEKFLALMRDRNEWYTKVG